MSRIREDPMFQVRKEQLRRKLLIDSNPLLQAQIAAGKVAKENAMKRKLRQAQGAESKAKEEKRAVKLAKKAKKEKRKLAKKEQTKERKEKRKMRKKEKKETQKEYKREKRKKKVETKKTRRGDSSDAAESSGSGSDSEDSRSSSNSESDGGERAGKKNEVVKRKLGDSDVTIKKSATSSSTGTTGPGASTHSTSSSGRTSISMRADETASSFACAKSNSNAIVGRAGAETSRSVERTYDALGRLIGADPEWKRRLEAKREQAWRESREGRGLPAPAPAGRRRSRDRERLTESEKRRRLEAMREAGKEHTEGKRQAWQNLAEDEDCEEKREQRVRMQRNMEGDGDNLSYIGRSADLDNSGRSLAQELRSRQARRQRDGLKDKYLE